MTSGLPDTSTSALLQAFCLRILAAGVITGTSPLVPIGMSTAHLKTEMKTRNPHHEPFLPSPPATLCPSTFIKYFLSSHSFLKLLLAPHHQGICSNGAFLQGH